MQNPECNLRNDTRSMAVNFSDAFNCLRTLAKDFDTLLREIHGEQASVPKEITGTNTQTIEPPYSILTEGPEYIRAQVQDIRNILNELRGLLL